MGNSKLRTLLALLVAMFVLTSVYAVSADVNAVIGDISTTESGTGEFTVTVPVTNGTDETTILVWSETDNDGNFTTGTGATDVPVYVDQVKGTTDTGASFRFIATGTEGDSLKVRVGGTGLTAVTQTMTLEPQATGFTVTFVDYDGITVLKTEEVASGGSATAPETNPTRTGWTFTGWNPADFSNITADLTVTATYSQNARTVLTANYGTISVTGYTDGTLDTQLPSTLAFTYGESQSVSISVGWSPINYSTVGPQQVTGTLSDTELQQGNFEFTGNITATVTLSNKVTGWNVDPVTILTTDTLNLDGKNVTVSYTVGGEPQTAPIGVVWDIDGSNYIPGVAGTYQVSGEFVAEDLTAAGLTLGTGLDPLEIIVYVEEENISLNVNGYTAEAAVVEIGKAINVSIDGFIDAVAPEGRKFAFIMTDISENAERPIESDDIWQSEKTYIFPALSDMKGKKITVFVSDKSTEYTKIIFGSAYLYKGRIYVNDKNNTSNYSAYTINKSKGLKVSKNIEAYNEKDDNYAINALVKYVIMPYNAGVYDPSGTILAENATGEFTSEALATLPPNSYAFQLWALFDTDGDEVYDDYVTGRTINIMPSALNATIKINEKAGSGIRVIGNSMDVTATLHGSQGATGAEYAFEVINYIGADTSAVTEPINGYRTWPPVGQKDTIDLTPYEDNTTEKAYTLIMYLRQNGEGTHDAVLPRTIYKALSITGPYVKFNDVRRGAITYIPGTSADIINIGAGITYVPNGDTVTYKVKVTSLETKELVYESGMTAYGTNVEFNASTELDQGYSYKVEIEVYVNGTFDAKTTTCHIYKI